MSDSYYASNPVDQFLHWASVNQALFLLRALVLILVVVGLFVAAPWLAEAAEWVQKRIQVAGWAAWRWVVRLATTGMGRGEDTCAGLGILDAEAPDDPGDGGEGEAADVDAEPFDPLTSPVVPDEATPLHDALHAALNPPAWHSTFTQEWKVIDTDGLVDPGRNYAQTQLGLPLFAELDKAGAR